MFRQFKRICSISRDLSCNKPVWATYRRKQAKLHRLAFETLWQLLLGYMILLLWPGWSPHHQKHLSAWFRAVYFGWCSFLQLKSFFLLLGPSGYIIFLWVSPLWMQILQNTFILWWQNLLLGREESQILSTGISIHCTVWWEGHSL